MITEELSSGATKYLVILNASGNYVKIGQGGQFHGASDLTSKTVIASKEGSLAANKVSNSSVTMSDLTFAVIKLS